jgi:DNA polymerase-1
MGLDTGARNKKNKMSTSKKLLEKINHPIIEKILRYREVSKWENTYVKPMLKLADSNKPVRFKYYTCGVPTGRFSSGKDIKNSYFAPVNAQSILKPKKEIKYLYEDSSADFGYVLKDEENDYPVEIPKLKINVRHAIKAPEDFYFIKCDYSGQELRIAANASKEQVWIDAFLNGVDLHSMISQKIFGSTSGNLRTQAKAVNFGIIYGASPYSHARDFNKPIHEAEEFFKEYEDANPALFKWIRAIQKKAMKKGMIYTDFGRPRRLHHYMSSPSIKVREYGKRSAVNGFVQGTAADIFRISFVNLTNKVFMKYPEDVKFQLVVHDEIDFWLRKTRLDLLDYIVDIMRIKRSDWAVPMDVGVEIGSSYGDLVEMNKREDGLWFPKKA